MSKVFLRIANKLTSSLSALSKLNAGGGGGGGGSCNCLQPITILHLVVNKSQVQIYYRNENLTKLFSHVCNGKKTF